MKTWVPIALLLLFTGLFAVAVIVSSSGGTWSKGTSSAGTVYFGLQHVEANGVSVTYSAIEDNVPGLDLGDVKMGGMLASAFIGISAIFGACSFLIALLSFCGKGPAGLSRFVFLTAPLWAFSAWWPVYGWKFKAHQQLVDKSFDDDAISLGYCFWIWAFMGFGFSIVAALLSMVVHRKAVAGAVAGAPSAYETMNAPRSGEDSSW